MAEMFFRSAGKSSKYGCYSERGLMSYLMFVCLPQPEKLRHFLKQLEFPDNVLNPFRKKRKLPAKITIFSELDLGSVGFGCPDGAIYFHYPQPTMLFIETKFNETYRQSCQKRRYNSTIQGQLELRWRLTHLHFTKSHKIYNKQNYLVETHAFKNAYRKKDVFYAHPTRKDESRRGSWRRLKIEKGVKEFLDKLGLCEGRVYFCAITHDEKNPFNTVGKKLVPRCGDLKWDDAKHKFCWLSKKEMVKLTEELQTEDSPNA